MGKKQLIVEIYFKITTMQDKPFHLFF